MSHSQKTALLIQLEFLSATLEIHAENADMWEIGAQIEDIIAVVRATPTREK